MQSIKLSQALFEAEKDYPCATSVSRALIEQAPGLFTGALEFMIARYGDRFFASAEKLLALDQAMGGDPVNAIIRYTYVTLREQVKFMQTQEYTRNSFEDAFRDVYDNAEVMAGFYLEGLLLSHAFWPVHFEISDFFEREFLPLLDHSRAGLEVGFGHGLYLLKVLQSSALSSVAGYDISKHSVAYTEKLLTTSGIARERFRVALADVREALPCADGSYNYAIFAEILEHIPNPLESMKEVVRCVSPGGVLFITTVVNANAIDHLYLFKTIDEVKVLLRDAGLEIVCERVLPIAELGGSAEDPSVDIACVARKVKK